ncbi:MAG TPA: hypothetical protein VIH13_01865 [Candidatus Hydromicrobium sp.]
MKEEEKDKFEASILKYIEEAERENEELQNKQDVIVDRMFELQDTIKNLKETLQYHQKKIGKSIKKERFSNVKNLAEASAILIEEQKEMNIDQIVKALKKGGFKFKTEQPGRAIFFAVYRHPHIIKTGKGLYKWVETKEGEENK